MNPSRHFIIAIASCLIAGGLAAQQPSTDRSDPAKVARAFLDALELERVPADSARGVRKPPN
ncbi:MAG TPA: hypothetical protein VFT29_12095 [Gemmatimonadaceae bacterium]|nr:hypothetical protein [Gemmatimonadaceae bacterium]